MDRFNIRDFELIKKYRWQSQFFVYLKYMLGIIVIPFVVLNLFMYLYLSRNVNDDMDRLLQQSISRVERHLNSKLTEFDRYYSLFCTDDAVYTFLTRKNITGNNHVISKNMQQIGDFVSEMLLHSPYLDSVYLYSSYNDYVFSNKQSAVRENFYDTTWYQAYKETGKTNFIYTHKVEWLQTEVTLISQCYEIFINKNAVGLLVINIDSQKLLEQLSVGQEELCLADIEGNILYSTDAQKFGGNIKDYELLNGENPNEEEYVVHRRDGAITVRKQLEDYPYIISSTVSEQIVSNQNANLFAYTIFIIFITMIAFLVIALYGSLKFYRSIIDIIAMVEAPIDYLAGNKTSNELRLLSEKALLNLDNLKDIEQKLVEKVESLKKMQSIALQTQINPHFLFNTLNLVNTIILEESGKDNDATHTICLLSDLVYSALDTKRYFVTVREELTYAEKFLEIELIKLDRTFKVVWDIDEQVLDFTTLKMILQPIIENGVEHGVKLMRQGCGRIEIKAKVEDDDLLFIVKNNGPQISSDVLRDLQQRLLSDEIPESKNIGLFNVNQRIKLIFGADYGCSIESDDSGTKVTIALPIDTQ